MKIGFINILSYKIDRCREIEKSWHKINGLTDSLHDKGLVLKTASHPACGSQFA